ncbi:MAG: NAD(P)-binding protein, partial [Anaerovoracaceae bacterium]
MYDICIIGGGASGIAAAIEIKNHSDVSICLLEKNNKLGKKLY